MNSSEKHKQSPSTRNGRLGVLAPLHRGRGSGAPSRLLVLLGLLGLLIVLLVIAAPVSAAPARPPLETFGPTAQPSFGEAEGIAVDQSTGDLLVIDRSAGTVGRYHSDGTPADFSALGTNVIDGKGSGPSCTPPSEECDGTPQDELSFGPANEVQVAVDNSGGATDGDIYVTQSGVHLVDIFAADGGYLGQLTESSSGPLGEVCGVAVGPEGDVYLGDYNNGVYRFSDPPVDGAGQLVVSTTEVCNLAVGAGSIFVTYDAGAHNVAKFDATTGLEDYELAPGPDTTVSVDPDTGNVFVAGEETVTEYHAGASTARVISSTELASTVQGIAVDEESGNLYASREGGEHVEIFGPLPSGTRPPLETFGPTAQPSFGEAEGIAVDQSTGDLLVIDRSAGTVGRYHSDGTPADFSALGTNVIDGKGSGPSCTPPSEECDGTPQDELSFGPANEVQVAVDNSGGATDGDIYVTQSGVHLVDIFAADGGYLGQLTESSSGPLGEVCGVAVGPEGDVYLGDYNNGVYRFSDPPVDGAGQLVVSTTEVCNLAVGAGSIFVTYDAGAHNVAKFDATTGLEDYELAPGPDTTVSVDPDTGNVFVAGEETVTEYHAGASTARVISSTELASTVQGIAVDEESGNLYASREGGEHVEIFGPPVYGSQTPKLKVVKSGTGTGTVTSAPSGISCGSTCSANFAENEVVKLTGAPGANTQPVAWTGCDAVTGLNECEVTMSAAKEVTATFTLVKHLLTVTKSGPGPGTVTGGSAGEPNTINCGSVCGHAYPHGTLVTLKGTGNPRPIVWTGCDTVNGSGECEVTLTAAKLVDAEFSPLPDPPLVVTDGVGAGPEPDLMTLEGRVDPNGFAVSECRFLYGSTTEYGESTPCVPAAAALGSGNGDVSVTATTEPLDPNTTYHFRLQASNPGGTAQGEDRTFTTGASGRLDSCPNAAIRAEQGAKALRLPDCMALELVSPAVKNQQYARGPSVSADGDRVLFTSSAALGDTPLRIEAGGDPYVASRGPSGWQTASTSPPPAFLQPEPEEPKVANLSPDFSHWFLLAGPGGKPALGVAQIFQSGLGGALSPISPVLTPLSGAGNAEIKDSSADRSHVYLQTSGVGVQGIQTTYLSGDPEPEGFLAEANTYIASLDPGGPPSLALLPRDRDGKAWGGECGARLGGIDPTQSGIYLPNYGLRSQGAVSPDGRRVYFSTRPDQPAAGPCLETSKMRIMVREETATGPKIEELFQSECDRVGPACSTDVGDDSYQGASVDQTRVYFTTNRQLVDTDRDGSSTSCSATTAVPGCDLYVYDSTKPAGERLTQVSAGDASDPSPGEEADVVNGITAISADGSHVYFVADGVLTKRKNSEGAEAQEGQPNLYVYTYPAKETAFIGTLAAADQGTGSGGLFGGGSTWESGAYPVPVMGTDAQDSQVGGDGRILLFRSKAALTAGDTNGAADIFRYDADSGSLERISAPEPGGSDSGAFDATTGFSPGTSGPAFAVIGRWVSEDGESVVFKTAQPLVPGDVNGLADSYMWRDGKLFRLPGTAESVPPTLSPDGSTVAFTSDEVKLLPGDGDGAADVYVARVDGGYPPPPPALSCAGEEGCQGAPATSPGQIGAASSTFAGTGNPKATPRRPKCHKGKARSHGRCVKKQTKKEHHKKHHRKLHHKERRHRRPHRNAVHGHGDSR